MTEGHEILWADDGGIGYRCLRDSPGTHSGVVHGTDERDVVTKCPTCGQHLKATWHVFLTPTTDPVTDE